MKSESSALARELHELSERLRVLESKLTSPATKLAGGQYYLDGQPVSMEVLSEFKSSLDHSRDSVWALLDVAAGYSGHTIEETLQNHRMQRASELLHVLRHEVEFPTRPQSAASRLFLEEVQVVADLVLRRHTNSRHK